MMSPWGRRQEYEPGRVDKSPCAHLPMSTETSSAPRGGEAIGLLLSDDPYWLLRQACGRGGSVESFWCSTVVYLSSPQTCSSSERVTAV